MNPPAPFVRDMVCCGACGYFNPYEAYDGPQDAGPGECWRFPHHEMIKRPYAHQCGEGVRANR